MSGELVVAVFLHDNQDLYLTDAGTGQLTRVTHDPAADGVPVWSPDGSQLAFVRFAQDGSSRIHVMNADGSGDHILTAGGLSSEVSATWSPDGRRVAFASIRGGGGGPYDSTIETIGIDGRGLRQLTHESDHPNDPVWSPDGALIAFDVGDPQPSLYVMDTSGQHRRRLSPPDARLQINWPLVWSPDGSALAFAGGGPHGQRDVYVVSRDGSRFIDLTGDRGIEGAPAWSPDGRRLAFWSNRDGAGDLYVIARGGGTPTRLTTGSHLSGLTTLTWSPDGARLIVWNSPKGQGGALNYTLNAAGGSLHRLSETPGNEFMALWRPHR